MGVDRVAARRGLTRDLMRHVRDPWFRDGALVRNQEGQYSLVPVLMDDTVAYLAARLAELDAAGPVNIAVREGDRITLVIACPASPAAPLSDMDCPVTGQSEVGMILALLRERAGRPVVCRVVAPACKMELGPGSGELTSAPA